MSGYSVQERIEVYKCARRKYQTILKNDKDGVIPLYREKFLHTEERTRENARKQTAGIRMVVMTQLYL